MNYLMILSLAVCAQTTFAQIYYDQPIAYQLAAANQAYQPSKFQKYDSVVAPPHRAVEINAAHESLLPAELLKSKRFYDNPRIAAALANESWFTEKEMPIKHREAEKIPREQIYKLAKNAGFITRRR